MKDFTDNFSKQSAIYSKYRPQYPTGLFEYLALLTGNHDLAWDCGTGNGQAAISIAHHFKKVIATDPSEQQIKFAFPDPAVSYRVERAEQSSLVSESVDLITIANALHWFDFDSFFTEVDRVLKPNGILAAWAYEVPRVSLEIDKITRHFHDTTVDEFWAAPNRLVENEYRDLPFPYPLIETPVFYSHREFDLADFIAYFNTWSATQKFIAKHGSNPTVQLKKDLLQHWKNPAEKKRVTWKLILRIGRKN